MVDSFGRRCVLGLAMALGVSTSSLAQAVPADEAGRRGIELGIVVNQTFSASGQEFYRRFTDFWREKPDFESYTLVVLERPSSRFGSRVVVSYGQTVVFMGNLPVKTDAIRALGAEAVERAHASVVAANLRMDGASDPDMGPNEI
ncbi:MAG: CsgE family curli-type amyloid fiber assembly protein [Betaproteobacteria bacterium]